MKLMMLGASGAQLQGIKEAQAMGHNVVTCDYIPEAIGHAVSDEQYFASTFHKDKVLEAAKAAKVQGIMTMGTDQPVLTAAYVAHELGLPSMLSLETALAVTNKRVMKQWFDLYDIPTAPWLIYEKGVNDEVLDTLSYPVVVKPVDSQGQRGVMFLQSPEEVRERYDDVTVHSRENHILVEAFYPNDEVTVSGWVSDGKVTILAMTDRVTFRDTGHLGVCLAHRYPTKHAEGHGETLMALTVKIVETFKICEGPIYFQFLIGEEGILANEVACRIGGAYEGLYMPYVTGFDLCGAMIRATCGEGVQTTVNVGYSCMEPDKYLTVQLFFCHPCKLTAMTDRNEVMALEGVLDCGYNYHVGDQVLLTGDATSRAGYVVVMADSYDQLKDRYEKVKQTLAFQDEEGSNPLIWGPV